MKATPLIIIIIGILLVGGGIYAYMAAQDDTNTADANEAAMTEDEKTEGDDAMMEDDVMEETNTNTAANTNASATTEQTSAQYREYSSATLAEAQSTEDGDTVLYFHADWCPTCRVLEPSIEQNISALPANLTILKVDYDTETALKTRYGVTYQHTFVQVDTDGNKLKLWSGSTNALDIAEQVI